MRWFAPLLLLVLNPVHAGVVDASTDRALCQAAVTDSALPVELNDLIENGEFDFDDARGLLSLDCGGRSLLQAMLEEQQAENLEYAVIDLGVGINEPVVTTEDGSRLSVVQWLERQAAQHDNAEVRDFAASYLARFRDESFNPNLIVSAQ